MKNTRKTVPFLLLSTMALGLIVAVTADRAPEADPLLEDEIVTTEDGGRAIAFGNHVKKANEVDTAHPVLGIDVTDVGENKAVRFVGAGVGDGSTAGAPSLTPPGAWGWDCPWRAPLPSSTAAPWPWS